MEDGAVASTLAAYELRMAYKLSKGTKQLVAGDKVTSRDSYGWIEQSCADMTSREIYEPQDYHQVPAQNRLFICPEDVPEPGAKGLF